MLLNLFADMKIMLVAWWRGLKGLSFPIEPFPGSVMKACLQAASTAWIIPWLHSINLTEALPEMDTPHTFALIIARLPTSLPVLAPVDCYVYHRT